MHICAAGAMAAPSGVDNQAIALSGNSSGRTKRHSLSTAARLGRLLSQSTATPSSDWCSESWSLTPNAFAVKAGQRRT